MLISAVEKSKASKGARGCVEEAGFFKYIKEKVHFYKVDRKGLTEKLIDYLSIFLKENKKQVKEIPQGRFKAIYFFTKILTL